MTEKPTHILLYQLHAILNATHLIVLDALDGVVEGAQMNRNLPVNIQSSAYKKLQDVALIVVSGSTIPEVLNKIIMDFDVNKLKKEYK